MDILYTALTVALMGVSYIVGLGRGRYGDKKHKMLTMTQCGCDHANNLHANGGKGNCTWTKNEPEKGKSWVCQCLRFTPKEEDN